MTTQVVRGTRQQIAETVARTTGHILEAVLFVEDAAEPAQPLTDEQFQLLVAEMKANAVSVGGADYSRESIYARLEGE